MKLISKDELVAAIRSRLLPAIVPDGTHYDDWDYGADSERATILSFINTLEVKEVNLEEIIEQTYHDRSVADTSDMDHVDYENIARYFFELGLAQSSSDEVKIGESQIYLNDDGGEPPYDGKQWLDLSCTEYEIPSDKFKDGDKIEIFIRKVKKGE